MSFYKALEARSYMSVGIKGLLIFARIMLPPHDRSLALNRVLKVMHKLVQLNQLPQDLYGKLVFLGATSEWLDYAARVYRQVNALRKDHQEAYLHLLRIMG